MAEERRVLYVGGLSEDVSETVVEECFRPFGDLVLPINMPKDPDSGRHKGFAFVEFELQEDAAAAIENMNASEIYGRVLKVNLARPDAVKGQRNKAVWDTKREEKPEDVEEDEAMAEGS
ncbi:Peptidyl-prolyl cis-trans isomerase E [Diplonema papillatum]|nr:Peptidyl-prolyl cis-trans isomerase E [Diplonema papillatum]WGM50000.1 PPIE [Diplonema papillatum]